MILWVRNLDGTQLIDFSAPCDIDWGHTVVLGYKMGWSIWCPRWFHVYVWHLEVWNQGISRYILPLKALRTDSSFLIFKMIYSSRPHHVVCGILVLQLGTEALPPALGTWSRNHWTTRGVLGGILVCFWPLVVASSPWHFLAIDASLESLPPCSHGPLPWVPSSYKDASHTGFRAHPDPIWPRLNLIKSVITLFPNKVTFTGFS